MFSRARGRRLARERIYGVWLEGVGKMYVTRLHGFGGEKGVVNKINDQNAVWWCGGESGGIKLPAIKKYGSRGVGGVLKKSFL